MLMTQTNEFWQIIQLNFFPIGKCNTEKFIFLDAPDLKTQTRSWHHDCYIYICNYFYGLYFVSAKCLWFFYLKEKMPVIGGTVGKSYIRLILNCPKKTINWLEARAFTWNNLACCWSLGTTIQGHFFFLLFFLLWSFFYFLVFLSCFVFLDYLSSINYF